MNKKILIRFSFVFAVLFQLLLLFSFIYDKEDIINNGSEFKFMITKFKPSNLDGRNYICLNLKEEFISDEKIQIFDNLFVSIKENSDGFASITSISKERPVDTSDYVKAISFHSRYGTTNYMLPFNIFYFKEVYADEIKSIYKKCIKDSSKKVYALVSIKNGKGLLKDLFIDDVSIMDMIEK